MRKPFNGDYILTQGFGLNPQDYARFGLKGHDGLDYGLPTGTEVIAPHSGKVIEAANDPAGYGNYLKIENSIEGSVLAHLKDFTVSVGQIVTEGQLIAHSDNTGNSTGAHLHWGYYRFPRDRQNGYAGFIDQLPLLTISGDSMATISQKDLDALRNERDKNWNDLQATKATLESVNQLVNDKNNEIAQCKSELSSLSSQVLSLQTAKESLEEIAKRVPQLEKERDQALQDRTLCLSSQESLNKRIAQLQNSSYLTTKTSILIQEVTRRLFHLT